MKTLALTCLLLTACQHTPEPVVSVPEPVRVLQADEVAVKRSTLTQLYIRLFAAERGERAAQDALRRLQWKQRASR